MTRAAKRKLRKQAVQRKAESEELDRPDEVIDADHYWQVEDIIDENETHYKLKWAPVRKGKKLIRYKPSWEPKSYVTHDLIVIWESNKIDRDSRTGTKDASVKSHKRGRSTTDSLSPIPLVGRASRHIVRSSPEPDQGDETDRPPSKRRRTARYSEISVNKITEATNPRSVDSVDSTPRKQRLPPTTDLVRVEIPPPRDFNREDFVIFDQPPSDLEGLSQSFRVNSATSTQIEEGSGDPPVATELSARSVYPLPFTSNLRVVPDSQSLTKTPTTTDREETQSQAVGGSEQPPAEDRSLGGAFQLTSVEAEHLYTDSDPSKETTLLSQSRKPSDQVGSVLQSAGIVPLTSAQENNRQVTLATNFEQGRQIAQKALASLSFLNSESAEHESPKLASSNGDPSQIKTDLGDKIGYSSNQDTAVGTALASSLSLQAGQRDCCLIQTSQSDQHVKNVQSQTNSVVYSPTSPMKYNNPPSWSTTEDIEKSDKNSLQTQLPAIVRRNAEQDYEISNTYRKTENHIPSIVGNGRFTDHQSRQTSADNTQSASADVTRRSLLPSKKQDRNGNTGVSLGDSTRAKARATSPASDTIKSSIEHSEAVNRSKLSYNPSSLGEYSETLPWAPVVIPEDTLASKAPSRPWTPSMASLSPSATATSRATPETERLSFRERRRKYWQNRPSPAITTSVLQNRDPASTGNAKTSPPASPTKSIPAAVDRSPEHDQDPDGVSRSSKIPIDVDQSMPTPSNRPESSSVIDQKRLEHGVIPVPPRILRCADVVKSTNDGNAALETNMIVLPLPLSPTAQEVYQQALAYDADRIIEFLNLPDGCEEVELEDSIQDLLSRLHDISSHSDLSDNGTWTQQDASPILQAEWDITCSTKFAFLGAFFDVARTAEKNVIICSKPGRLMNMLDNFMHCVSLPFSKGDNLSIYQSKERRRLKIRLLSTADELGTEFVVPPADLVIGFDETFRTISDKVAEQCQSMRQEHHICSVVSFATTYCLEHIDSSLPSSLSGINRTKALLHHSLTLSKDVGKLPPGFPSPRDLGHAVGQALLGGEEETWGLRSIDEVSLQLETSGEVGISVPLESTEGVSQKRRFEDEGLDSIPTKRSRLSPIGDNIQQPSSSWTTRVTDSHLTSHSQSGTATTALLEKSIAREGTLQKQLDTAQSLARSYESDLSSLQTRYEDQARELTSVRAQAAIAQKSLAAAETSNTKLAATIADLKAKQDVLRSEIADVRNACLASSVPEVRELEELRAKVRKSEALEKRLQSQQSDFDFMRHQYQAASAAAAQSASEVAALTEENEMLAAQANGEKVKLRREFEKSGLSLAYGELEKMSRQKAQAEMLASRLTERLAALQEKEKDRAAKAGMALSTRASSLPPSQPGLAPGAGLRKGPVASGAASLARQVASALGKGPDGASKSVGGSRQTSPPSGARLVAALLKPKS